MNYVSVGITYAYQPEVLIYMVDIHKYLATGLIHFKFSFAVYLHGKVCTAVQEGHVHTACQSQITWASGYLPLSCQVDYQWFLCKRQIIVFGVTPKSNALNIC